MKCAKVWMICAFFQPHLLLSRVRNGASAEEQEQLKAISSKAELTPTLLPIKTVGVQVRGGELLMVVVPTLLRIETVGVQVRGGELVVVVVVPTLIPPPKKKVFVVVLFLSLMFH